MFLWVSGASRNKKSEESKHYMLFLSRLSISYNSNQMPTPTRHFWHISIPSKITFWEEPMTCYQRISLSIPTIRYTTFSQITYYQKENAKLPHPSFFKPAQPEPEIVGSRDHLRLLSLFLVTRRWLWEQHNDKATFERKVKQFTNGPVTIEFCHNIGNCVLVCPKSINVDRVMRGFFLLAALN